MHASRFEIAGYKGEVTVHHNGDWSGDALVVFQEDTFEGSLDKADMPVKEVEIPARLLIGLGLQVAQVAVGHALVAFAEDLPRILRLRKIMDMDPKKSKKKGKRASRRTGKKVGE